MKKITLFKTLLMAAALLTGSSAWADDNEVTLNCTSSITVVGATSYGTDGSAYENLFRLNSWKGQGGAGAIAFTLDSDWDPSKVKSAILKIYPTSKCNKSRSGDIYIKSIDGYPDLSANENSSFSTGKHIVYKETSSTNKCYTFTGTTQATISASATTSGVPAQGAYYSVNLTTYIQSLSTKSAGDVIYFGIDISDWALDSQFGAYGNSNAPKLVITYSSETLYTATFTANEGAITPTVTIYSDADRTATVSNGTLTDGNTYYYRAVLGGYQNAEGSFTVSGANPSVNFTMTAKTPVTSMKVNYTYGGSVIYTDNQSTTGLYVGESYTAPFRMYILQDGALYKTTRESSNPWYGTAVTLTDNTVIEKALTPVDLNGGVVVLFEDFDGTDAQNAGIRASYRSAYDNTAYTSAEDLPAGNYTFYLYVQNQGRGSSIKVGDTEIFAVSEFGKGSWNDKTIASIDVPTAGKLTIAAGSTGTRDDYDIIIAVLNPVPATITSAGWATLYTPYALDFSSVDGLTAYTASLSDKTVTLTKVNDVPANTGVVLQGAAGTYNIPVAASSATAKGDLQGSTTATTVDADKKYYVLAKNGDNVQFSPVENGESIAAGKAYLVVDGAGANLRVVFGDEATAINALNAVKAESDVLYNVAGQRVSDSYKGIVIKNGKKYLNK